MENLQGRTLSDSVCREGYSNYLVGKYFGILKDREKNKPYDKLLDSLILDLIGAVHEYDCINLHKLFYKTLSLRYLTYPMFREDIMECIKLAKSVFGEGYSYGG